MTSCRSDFESAVAVVVDVAGPSDSGCSLGSSRSWTLAEVVVVVAAAAGG